MNFRNSKASAHGDSASVNRRRQPRSRVRLKADVTLPGDLTIVGHTLDISAGGMSLEVPYMLKLGDRCEIEMNLSRMGGPAWVQVVAEVRHCSQIDEEKYMVGLQFVDLTDAVRNVLDDYVWSRLNAAAQ